MGVGFWRVPFKVVDGVAVSWENVFVDGQPFQADGAAAVQAVGTDADFGA